MRSKMVIDKINDMKMKIGSKVTLRKTVKTKRGFELSTKAVNSAKRKRFEDVMDIGHVQNIKRCNDGATHPHGRSKISQLKDHEK